VRVEFAGATVLMQTKVVSAQLATAATEGPTMSGELAAESQEQAVSVVTQMESVVEVQEVEAAVKGN
jgi:hypothetical protein